MRRGGDAVVSFFESASDITKTNLHGRPILSFAVIGLMVIIVIIVQASFFHFPSGTTISLIAGVMLFVIVISCISYMSNRSSSQTTATPESDVDKIKIVDPKKDESIWAGFEELYYAFNAPFELEKDYSTPKKQSTYEIHRERYRDKKFEAKYLYFTGENKVEREVFKRWITNFKEFFDEIETARLGDNLKLYIVKDEKIPDYTLFVGKKKGEDCSIIYPFRQKSGSPKDVFLVYDTGFAKTLLGIFEGAMGRAKAQKGEIKTMGELSKYVKNINVKDGGR